MALPTFSSFSRPRGAARALLIGLLAAASAGAFAQNHRGNAFDAMRNLRSITEATQSQLSGDLPLADDEGRVVMYRTAWCGYCKQAASHMRKNQVPYVEYDIEQAGPHQQAYKRYGGRGVPLIVFGHKTLSGFDARRFDTMYAEYGGGGGAPMGAQHSGQYPDQRQGQYQGQPVDPSGMGGADVSRERGAAAFDRGAWLPPGMVRRR